MCYFISRCLTRWLGVLVNVLLRKLMISLRKSNVNYLFYSSLPMLSRIHTKWYKKTPQTVDQQAIERFHSRGRRLCKCIATKESVCIRKESNSHRIGLGHQHGRRFVVLGHQYGRRDVVWKHSIRAVYFQWMDTMWSRIYGKIISCKSEATAHK